MSRALVQCGDREHVLVRTVAFGGESPRPAASVLRAHAHLAEGAKVCLVVLTTASPPLFEPPRRHARPGAALGAERESRRTVFAEVRPDVVFVPFNGDMHRDHQLAFTSVLVCCRPGSPFAPRAVYA